MCSEEGESVLFQQYGYVLLRIAFRFLSTLVWGLKFWAPNFKHIVQVKSRTKAKSLEAFHIPHL
jgi:hypothetical protein